MTSGDTDVTSGERLNWTPIALVALGGVAIVAVNASSQLADYARMGREVHPAEPWLWELTSVLWVVALSPFIDLMVRRFPPTRAGWRRAVVGHLFGAVAFSIAHIAGMVALREALYLVLPGDYDFGGGDLVAGVLYEARKDALTYVGIGAFLWVWRTWRPGAGVAAERPGDGPASDTRIEVRDGGRVMMLEATSICWVQAAGNYVEIHTAHGVHTVRQTLASFAERASAAGLVRIHRSRLVNPARVTSYQSTPSGDVEIALDDGTTLTGSRRFRAALTAALK